VPNDLAVVGKAEQQPCAEQVVRQSGREAASRVRRRQQGLWRVASTAVLYGRLTVQRHTVLQDC
jgi:hypothetical protein